MHKAYKHIVVGAEKAVLFIHGIVGTPNHFQAFIQRVGQDISVYNLLLDGHGKGVKEFSKTSMKIWEQQVSSAIDELAATHKEVFVVAHSMGCLLALGNGQVDSKISKMFLMAVPLRISLKPSVFVNSSKVYFDKIDPQDVMAEAAKQCCGINHSKNPFSYLGWIPRFLELLQKAKKIRKHIQDVCVPCVAYQSVGDEMVSRKSVDILRENPNIQAIELKKSTHFYYEAEDFSELLSDFDAFIT